jgi:WD40 repeat protein
VRSCAIAPDGRWLVTTSDDRTAIIWETATGSPLTAVRVTQPLSATAWLPANSAVLITGGPNVYLFDVKHPNPSATTVR